MRVIKKIFVHHSASHAGVHTWAEIRDYHVNVRGWRDIGYHGGVVFDRGVWRVVSGRAFDEQGAHVKGHNEDSVGFLFEGGYHQTPLSEAAFEVGSTELLRWLVDLGLVDRFLSDPRAVVLGHREAPYSTECPGTFFPIEQLRGRLQDMIRWGAVP